MLLPVYLSAPWKGPSREHSLSVIKLPCVVLNNTHFSGTGMEPILIRVGGTRSSKCHHETELLNNFFGFLPLQKKKISKGSPVSDLEAEAYFLIINSVI